jgi:hypothetical protein
MDLGSRRVDAGGYVLGQAFLDEVRAWDTTEDVRLFRGRVLIAQFLRGWSGGSGLRRELVRLDEAYRAAGADSRLVEPMEVHPSEWFRQPDYPSVWAATSEWLAAQPVPAS